jgi:hypothetical protein
VEIDDAIVQLGEKLDAWWDDIISPLLDSEDRVAQAKALLSGFELAKEFDRLKVDGLAAITALLARQDETTVEQRVASLIRGFEFGARLADTLDDEFSDVDGETRVVRLMDAIVDALDRIGSGRAALAGLLDHRDAGVRAWAGADLIDLMPERVVPILRQIEAKVDGGGASFRAYLTLLAWGREGKARFNS